MGFPANGNVLPLGDPARASARLSTQESASVLAGCRDLALGRLSRALAGMLDRVDDELSTLAGKTSDRDAKNVYLDARAQARDKRSAMEATFREHFADFFNRQVRGEKPSRGHAPTAGELSLMGHEELEESIAVGEMSRKLKAACEGELFALSQRFGFLMERPDLEDDGNPVSPAAICAALREACDRIESRLEVRLAVLHQIERHAGEELQRVYRELNTHLIERHILPEVRAVVRRAASMPAPTATSTPTPPAVPPTPARPQDLFATLSQLVQGSALAASPAASAAAGSQAAADAPLLAELTRLHRADGAGAEGAGDVLRALKAAPRDAPLGTVDAMTIDIVAMIFDYVFEDRHIPASIKASLGRLQIPILKVALMDKAFFSAKAHPARRLIDALAAASIGLDEANARGGETLALVEGVVAEVLDGFDTDVAVFEALLARVEAFVEEGRRTEAGVVELSAQLIESRERGEAARIAAREDVQRRLQARLWVPPVVRSMLLEYWTQALGAEIAESDRGDRWRDLVATMDDLLWSVEPKPSPEDRKRLVAMLPAMLKGLHRGMQLASMPAAEREAFLGALVDCHAMAVKAGMRGMAVLPGLPQAEPAREGLRIERAILPAGELKVQEIRLRGTRPADDVFTRTGVWMNLQRGTWVEFSHGEGPLRARLTWISPNKGVYLFTNPLSGDVAVSISPEALAEQMRLGEARMLDDAPLVERAVDSVIATLRQGAPQAARS